jgi:hypothetical protein
MKQSSICEFCATSHKGEFGSGRFCSAICARRYSANINRAETNAKISSSVKEFYRRNSRSREERKCQCGKRLSQNNKSGVCKWCKPPAKSHSEIVSDFRRRRKLQAVEYKGGKCQICGYSRSYYSMIFHHRDPNKKDFSLSYHLARNPKNWEGVKKELDKCVLLCANCHGEVHQGLIFPP